MLKEIVQTEIADAFEAHYQIVVEKIERALEEAKDILDGTRKREVSNWWLSHIEKEADKVRHIGEFGLWIKSLPFSLYFYFHFHFHLLLPLLFPFFIFHFPSSFPFFISIFHFQAKNGKKKLPFSFPFSLFAINFIQKYAAVPGLPRLLFKYTPSQLP